MKKSTDPPENYLDGMLTDPDEIKHVVEYLLKIRADPKHFPPGLCAAHLEKNILDPLEIWLNTESEKMKGRQPHTGILTGGEFHFALSEIVDQLRSGNSVDQHEIDDLKERFREFHLVMGAAGLWQNEETRKQRSTGGKKRGEQEAIEAEPEHEKIRTLAREIWGKARIKRSVLWVAKEIQKNNPEITLKNRTIREIIKNLNPHKPREKSA